MRDPSRKRKRFGDLALGGGRHHFSKQILQAHIVKHGLGQQPLQLGIFFLKPAQPPRLT